MAQLELPLGVSPFGSLVISKKNIGARARLSPKLRMLGVGVRGRPCVGSTSERRPRDLPTRAAVQDPAAPVPTPVPGRSSPAGRAGALLPQMQVCCCALMIYRLLSLSSLKTKSSLLYADFKIVLSRNVQQFQKCLIIASSLCLFYNWPNKLG